MINAVNPLLSILPELKLHHTAPTSNNLLMFGTPRSTLLALANPPPQLLKLVRLPLEVTVCLLTMIGCPPSSLLSLLMVLLDSLPLHLSLLGVLHLPLRLDIRRLDLDLAVLAEVVD